MIRIAAEFQAFLPTGRESLLWKPFALQRVQHRVVPFEDAYAQIMAPVQQVLEQVAERGGNAVRRWSHEFDPAVDVPGENVDRAARVQHGRVHGRETRFAVDEEGKATRRFDAPAVAAYLQDRLAGTGE